MSNNQIEQLSKMPKEQRLELYKQNNIPNDQIEQIESQINNYTNSMQQSPNNSENQPNNKSNMSCPFCDIVNSKIDTKIVTNNNDFVAILDIQPKTPGHVVLISKRHIAQFDELNDSEIMSLNLIKKEVISKLKTQINATGYLTLNVNGLTSGQKLPHFSEHIIPTYGQTPELPGLDIIHSQNSSNLAKEFLSDKINTLLTNTQPKKESNQDSFKF
jgi:histidine triad (HIT) family protein